MDGCQQPTETFDGLLAAWLARLDTEELNKQFYRKLFDWFEWAVAEATFPTDEKRTLEPRGACHPVNHTPAIRVVY